MLFSIKTAHKSGAGMAELADALDLGSSEATRGGSTPSTRTMTSLKRITIQYERVRDAS